MQATQRALLGREGMVVLDEGQVQTRLGHTGGVPRFAEPTAVVAEGRITPWCTGIWNDQQVKAWRPVTDAIRAGGAASAIQLAHAGRKASTHRAQSGNGSVAIGDGGWQTVSATSEAFEGYAPPRELSTAEVAQIPLQFAEAAKRSVDAGFDAIEIHAAHGLPPKATELKLRAGEGITGWVARTGKPTRVGYRVESDGTKTRISRRTGAELS